MAKGGKQTTGKKQVKKRRVSEGRPQGVGSSLIEWSQSFYRYIQGVFSFMFFFAIISFRILSSSHGKLNGESKKID